MSNLPPRYKSVCLVPESNESLAINHIFDGFPPKCDHYFQSVVSVMGCRDYGFFHFPVEYVSTLNTLQNTDIGSSVFLIAKSSRDEFKKEWLRIAFPGQHLEVKEVQSFSKSYADDCFTVGAGISVKNFNYPIHLKKEIKWLQHQALNTVNIPGPKKDLLLIKRTKSRVLNNWEDLKSLCELYCHRFSLNLRIFDDSQTLGTVEEQLKLFNSSKIIVGSHGAGFTNIIGCTPGCSFLIECMSTREDKTKNGTVSLKEDPPCFEHIAEACKVHYQKTYLESNEVDITQVADCFKKLERLV